MKTTVEIPDMLFRKAKASAAQEGVSLKIFFVDAVQERLRRKSSSGPEEKPWMRAFGVLRDLHEENKSIDRVIKEEFERIDEEEWR